jgi:hypothetical protein
LPSDRSGNGHAAVQDVDFDDEIADDAIVDKPATDSSTRHGNRQFTSVECRENRCRCYAP